MVFTETRHYHLGISNRMKLSDHRNIPLKELFWITSDKLQRKTAIASQGDTRQTDNFKTRFFLLILLLREGLWIEHRFQSLGMLR
jgi:hypothetical protein